MSYIVATNKGNPYAVAYAHTSFAYGDIVSYAELALSLRWRFAYATAFQGAPSKTRKV